jgi:hypothetical protein
MNSGWQPKMQELIKTKYMSHIRQLHQTTVQWLQRNLKNIPERDVRSVDRPFDMVSFFYIQQHVLLNVFQQHRILLEASFEANCTPSAAEKEMLAKKTSMTIRQIEHWVRSIPHSSSLIHHQQIYVVSEQTPSHP